jgi:DNA repair exonuclease SbcCD ATPase subunit
MGMNDPVVVALTVEERAERADIMAGLLAEIAAIDRQRRAQNDEHLKRIKELRDRLEEHGNVLREGAEERRQMDLTFPQEQAARALHDVAAAACSCEGGAEAEAHDPACPVHGVERNADGTAKDAAERTEELDGDDETDLERGLDVREVIVGTVEEPAAVSEFRDAKAKRGRRAAAGDAA